MGARMQAFVMTGDVVVRTRAAAVCATERRIFSGEVAIPFPVIGGRVVPDAVNRCGRCYSCGRGQGHLCDRRGRAGMRRKWYGRLPGNRVSRFERIDIGP